MGKQRNERSFITALPCIYFPFLSFYLNEFLLQGLRQVCFLPINRAGSPLSPTANIQLPRTAIKVRNWSRTELHQLPTLSLIDDLAESVSASWHPAFSQSPVQEKKH